MVCKEALGGSLKPSLAVDNIKYQIAFARENPYYFSPDGVTIFTGFQGKGKTLSAVKYIWELTKIYPDVIIVSNCSLSLPGYNHEIIQYKGFEQIQKLDNGYLGIILFLDEIQSEFNSLQSKDIDPSWFQIISMQRKRRLHVVGTSQLYSRIAKPWREQFSNVIECECYFKILQANYVIDHEHAKENASGELEYDRCDSYFWFRDPQLYNMYDTWERVKKVEGVKKDDAERVRYRGGRGR